MQAKSHPRALNILFFGISLVTSQTIQQSFASGSTCFSDIEKLTSRPDTIKKDEIPLKSILEFTDNCRNQQCDVDAALLPERSKVAHFSINQGRYKICQEERRGLDQNPEKGCASAYQLSNLYIHININESSKELIYTTLLFQLIVPYPKSSKICYSVETNDGPSLATFSATYENNDAALYVYELDGYRTIQQSIAAKPLNIINQKSHGVEK